MTSFSPEYIETANIAAKNVVAHVMPFKDMPENLLEAFNDLSNSLLADENAMFTSAWDVLPASAKTLISQPQFHGFFIGQAWLKLSMAGQEIADMANTDDAIDEKAYQGVFAQLIIGALKDSLKKLKKARTDRSLLNSFKQLVG